MPNKRITELLTVPSILDGSEPIALVQGGITYKMTIGDLLGYFISTGVNRPPIAEDHTADVIDTDPQCTGNLLIGAYDPDGDPLVFQSLKYNGDEVPIEDGSFQTFYGIFFLNPDTGDWTFTLGPAAKALTTGQTAYEIFTYTLADGRGGLATHTLTITIVGTNSVPVVSSVNAQTPINVTVSGNLLYRNAFDYEPTPLFIASYTVDGVSGDRALGLPYTISGIGDITIASNGDYTFSPAEDFFGPVPTIIYVVSDGGNEVPAFLRLAVTPLIPGSRPIVLYTDIESGPTSGGEDNNGCYLSIYGVRYGSGTLGTNIRVKIGGVEVARYILKAPAVTEVSTKWGIERICVQVGHLTGLVPGRPYPIIVSVDGQDSNATCNFIPNPGRMIYVSQAGNDLTAVPGNMALPYRHLQMPERGDGGVYPILRAGDHVIIRGSAEDWTDLGYDTAWFRFRDPTQQGSTPTGEDGTGWISFMPYPGERVKYMTQPGTKGGFQGPGSAFNGTCGDWVTISNFEIEVLGGASSDAAPVNMQYNSERWRIVNNNFGPWHVGSSPHLNAACVTGQGNIILIAGNYLHDIEGSVELQNHGTYGGTSAYGWELMFNVIKNIPGGSGIQFNDSDGGTGTLNTPFGIWTGFTNIRLHHNWIENTAKYGITFSDVGAYTGELDFVAYNNVIIKTGLPPLRLNTTTASSNVLYCFNTVYDCNITASGSGNAMVRNEGVQNLPNHSVKVYDNILAFGPNTTPGCGWFSDYSGLGSGYDLKRNLYFAGTQTPGAPVDPLAIIADPLFVDASIYNFALQNSSPAANAGTQATPGVNVEDDFTAVATRQFGGAPDIGAFEIGENTPYVITVPVASGGPQVGVATSCTVGSWGNSPTSYTRQFKVDGANVGPPHTGTGAASYTPDASDVRKILSCSVTAENSEGASVYTVTRGTIAQGAGGPVNTGIPTITGTPAAGSTLTGHPGTWSGTVDSYTYQWNRDGIDTGDGGTTYLLGDADVGHVMSVTVYAENHITGSGVATSNPTGTIGAAPADPTFVQTDQGDIPTGTTPLAITLDSAVTGGHLVAAFHTSWNNNSYNCTITDSQGHSTGAGTILGESQFAVPSSGNPSGMWSWTQTNATGAYTMNFNNNISDGGVAIVLEVDGINPASVMDIPSEANTGTGTAVDLTSSTAITKPNDLILVGVAVQGTGHSITPGSGWTQVGTTESAAFSTVAVFKRKCTAIETFHFTATLDTSTGWGATSIVVKGS